MTIKYLPVNKDLQILLVALADIRHLDTVILLPYVPKAIQQANKNEALGRV